MLLSLSLSLYFDQIPCLPCPLLIIVTAAAAEDEVEEAAAASYMAKHDDNVVVVTLDRAKKASLQLHQDRLYTFHPRSEVLGEPSRQAGRQADRQAASGMLQPHGEAIVSSQGGHFYLS